MKTIFVIMCLTALALGDIYMHNPRGSNNRVDENANAPANRLFDSQNNNQAGYNRGEEDDQMAYYATSQLMVSWTSQHACGNNPQTHCDMIIQYRCDNKMRNGDSTDRPEDDLATPQSEPSADRGRHEPYMNWYECEQRARNAGLFIADQNVGNEAKNTRQNAGGGRSGYECAEERDYYPYWHPSYWTDVAIMTDNVSRCDYYQKESQNVKGKGYCSNIVDNNPQDCKANNGKWKTQKAFGVAAPDCVLAPWSRANLHGNAIGENGDDMTQAHYNWTMPNENSNACVLRVRYNMSTNDYDGWNTDAGSNGDQSPVTNNPDIDAGYGQELQLNINTAQFGRTFEDRSHTFAIMKRDNKVAGAETIYNLNVRGKRGNNAATYPNNEYDFHPPRFHVTKGDWVHWQWTGSNNNPNGNDRNNALQMQEDYNTAYPVMATDTTMFGDDKKAAESAAHSCGSQDENLQDVDPYCNVGLVQMNEVGTYDYMSTKNNAYTNRSQKGTIIVDKEGVSTGALIAIIIGSVAVVGGGAGAAVLYKKKFAGAAGAPGGRF